MDKALYKLARFYGATDLYKSNIEGKRYTVVFDNKIIHFGSSEGKAYIDHFDDKKRRAWYSRHYEILNKEGKRVIHLKSSPSFWSARLLWVTLPEKHFLSLSLEQKKERFINIVNKNY